MALTVQHLNADTTFLLTFAPAFAPRNHGRDFPGAFSILIDPWLSGQSSVFHPTFQRSNHTSKPAIESLADLKELPDLIIISQDKPDHCHQETLRSLPKDANIKILATPAAAKKIRSWKHFPDASVEAMRPWNAKRADTVLTIPLAAYTTTSAPGEITIANLPTKRDMTKLHNAIGITYRPPSTLLPARDGRTVDMSDMAMMTPPMTPRPRTAPAPATSPSSEDRPNFLDPLRKGPHSPPTSPKESPHTALYRIKSRADSATSHSSGRKQEKTISIIYTPHGVNYKSVVEPYAHAHLLPRNALPLTALFHSVNVEQNPWFMGGVVAAGAPGGLPIAQQLRAQHWIGAHDEDKNNRGMATVWIKSKQYTIKNLQDMLMKGMDDLAIHTKVHLLDVDETLRITG